MKNKKMIVVDLDGTLLDENKNISLNTIEYLSNLKNEGYIIVIATGRIFDSAVHITNGATFANYIISNAGGYIYDVNNKKMIAKNVIEKDMVKALCDFYHNDIIYIELCDLNYYNRYTLKDIEGHIFCKEIDDLDQFIKTHDIINIEVKSKSDLKELRDFIHDKFPSIDIYIMQDSFMPEKWLQIIGKGVDKYGALQILMGLEEISNDDVIAFGDSINDYQMIKNCGTGVAMDNAILDVKLVADYITKSHNEDGVIDFLKKFL